MLFCLFFNSFLKSDLFGEINGNLDTLKVFHILTVNLKSIHQLTDKNYKRLAILWRIAIVFIVLVINYGTTFLAILIPSLVLLIAVLYKRLYWFIHLISFTPSYIYFCFIAATVCGIFLIYILYHKFRFDQFNDQIKDANWRWKMITLGREKSFIQFINRHNSLSLEMNLKRWLTGNKNNNKY